MRSKEIFILLDTEIRLHYNSRAEFARKIGVSRSRLQTIMDKLENAKNDNNKKGLSFNTLSNILEKAGYRIKIEKV